MQRLADAPKATAPNSVVLQNVFWKWLLHSQVSTIWMEGNRTSLWSVQKIFSKPQGEQWSKCPKTTGCQTCQNIVMDWKFVSQRNSKSNHLELVIRTMQFLSATDADSPAALKNKQTWKPLLLTVVRCERDCLRPSIGHILGLVLLAKQNQTSNIQKKKMVK